MAPDSCASRWDYQLMRQNVPRPCSESIESAGRVTLGDSSSRHPLTMHRDLGHGDLVRSTPTVDVHLEACRGSLTSGLYQIHRLHYRSPVREWPMQFRRMEFRALSIRIVPELNGRLRGKTACCFGTLLACLLNVRTTRISRLKDSI